MERGIKGFNEGRTQISKAFVSKGYIAKREEVFRKWGLVTTNPTNETNTARS